MHVCCCKWCRAEVHTLAIPESKDDIKNFLKRNVKFGGDAGIKVRQASRTAHSLHVSAAVHGRARGVRLVQICWVPNRTSALA